MGTSDTPSESWSEWYNETGWEQLRALAREVWNPGGVGRRSRVYDLDAYLPGIVNAVRRGSTPEDLANYLRHTESRDFGGAQDEADILYAAEKILAWYEGAISALRDGAA
jgi:hypothetical protein